MLAGGKPVSKIAHDLSLSVKSVSTYRARILRKMGFKTNGALMRYAMSNNLVD
jgi:DNA-binding NarL/FixJ family response regulator